MIEPIKNYRFKNGQLHLKIKTKFVLHILLGFILGICGTFYTVSYYIPEPVTTVTPVIIQPTIQDRQQEYILQSNPKVTHADAKEIVEAITKWSQEFKIDPKLMLAVARQESNFDKYAISTSGAYGIMQVIPVWHKQKIVDAHSVIGNPELFNINTNVYLGTRVYQECQKKTKVVVKALECYYGKPNTGYAEKVLKHYKVLL